VPETPAGGATAHVELEEGYRFRVDFGDGRGVLLMDEPPPLGDGSGPNAAAVLGAAVANCLSASLLFCLRKAHIEVRSLAADVEVTSSRNQRGRLRVSSVRVRLHPKLTPGNEARVRRCLELFEDFCVVTEAVRGGIDVDVTVGIP
jgi:organic hydroperoxide reductase OsmC/OhrA